MKIYTSLALMLLTVMLCLSCKEEKKVRTVRKVQ